MLYVDFLSNSTRSQKYKMKNIWNSSHGAVVVSPGNNENENDIQHI